MGVCESNRTSLELKLRNALISSFASSVCKSNRTSLELKLIRNFVLRYFAVVCESNRTSLELKLRVRFRNPVSSYQSASLIAPVWN